MNNIFKHIEYLLLRHDCVIVPGLGAFIATSVPAMIDMENGMLMPPSRSVMFNQSVIVDDGLLATSYSRKGSFSFEEARQVIRQEVAALKSLLISAGEIKAGNLGKLVLGSEGKMSFIPAFTERELNIRLGYHSIFAGKISQVADQSTAVEPMDPNQADTVESDVATPDETERKHTFRFSKFKKSLSKIAAAFAVTATVASAILFAPRVTDSREQRASVVPVEAIINSAQKSASVAHVSKKDTVAEIPAKEAEIKNESTLPSHYLIVATFSNSSEATDYASRYTTPDYPLSTVSSRKMTRVAVAASNDMDSLRRRLNSREISSRFPNAWIWTRN